MASREERIARNEAFTREVNEGIQESVASASTDGFVHMICECGQMDCERLIPITMREYEEVRADPRRFAVVKEHVTPDVEFVVSEGDRFTVVQKREGEAADVAEALDPRS